MSLRQLVVLGTASQVPTKYRNHNGYLLLWDGQGILFDPGEGTQRQMTHAGLSATQITRICLTHFHGDHCLGLPGIIQRISLDEVPHPVTVHYPASGQAYFDRLRHASIFLDKSDIRPAPHHEPGEAWRDGDLVGSVAKLDHGAPAWGYRLQEPDGWRIDPDRAAALGVRGPLIGVLKQHGEVAVDGRVVRREEVAEVRRGQSVAFVMDTRPCASIAELAAGVDLLIIESTFLEAEREEAHAYGHLTAADAGRLAAEAGAATVVLTHFSQRYPRNAPFVEQAGRFHPNVVAATDLLRVDVPRPLPPRGPA